MPPDSPSKNKNRKFVDINKNCNEHALSTSNSAIQQIDRIPKGLIPQETIIFSPDVPASCQANKVKIVAKESTDFHAQAEYIVFDRYNRSKYSRTEAISDSENECKIVLMSLKSNKVLNTANSFSENNVCETDEELTSLSWLHDKNLIKGIVARTSHNKKNAIIEPNDVNDVYMMSEKKASTEEAEFEVKKIHIEDGNVFLQKPNTHDHILNSINMESNIDSGQQNIFYNVDYLDMNSNNKRLISSNINTCDEKGNQNATFEIHEDSGSWKKIECDEKFGTSNEELFKDTNATNGMAAFINKKTGVPYSPRKSSTNNALILKKPISNPTFKLHEYNTQQLSLRTAIQQECGAKMNEFDQNSLFCAITEVSSNSIHKNIHRLENSSLNSGHEHMLHSQQQNILDLKQKHKNVVLCDRPSNIHDLGKSPLSSPKKSLNVSYDPLVHTHNKPPYSFSSLIFMAIEASQEKALPVKEIYAWIVQHFPYFSTAPTGWKNSVRHNLSLNKSFVKVEKAPNMGKGSLWRVEQQQRENLIQALTRSPFFPNSKLGYTLQNRKVVNVEVDTFDLVPLSEKSYFDARLFPKLSKVIKSMEIQGHVENNSSNCSSSELDSYIYTKHPTIGCVGNSIDDVNAATAMLALKHGPKMLAEKFEACSQVILSTPSEDHTYSAGINNGNDMNLISKRKFENSPALLVDEIKIFAKNDYSSQSNATLSDAAYESSEENDDIATPFDDSDQQRHLDGVDALLSLSSSVESSFTSISNTSDNFFNAYGSFDQGCTSQNCHQHSLPDSPLKNKSRFYL